MKRIITFILLLTMVGCVSPAAIKAIDRGIAANKGHMDDASLPTEAREIATDNYDVFNQVKFNLDGTPVPANTAARKKVRDDAAAAAAEEGGGE